MQLRVGGGGGGGERGIIDYLSLPALPYDFTGNKLPPAKKQRNRQLLRRLKWTQSAQVTHWSLLGMSLARLVNNTTVVHRVEVDTLC